MSQEEIESSKSTGKKFSIDQFVNDNQRNLIIAGAALIVIAAGIWFYKFKYVPQQEAKANDAVFMAERYFGQDSSNLALNGDGNYSGLLDVMEEYSGTKAAQRAEYMAGSIMMREGKFEEAIDYLKKVNFHDEMVGPLCKCLIGDCYVQLDKYDEAADYFMKGAKAANNDFTTPYALQKAALVYHKLGEYDKEIEAYQRIKDEFSETRFSEGVDKYIARAEASAEFSGK
ncbi:MAG: tetratricopeptide repeat protein [Bacteroidetes bacterium]|nr:tetratricopeptide repeat protein [Bacteroidota bacterium]